MTTVNNSLDPLWAPSLAFVKCAKCSWVYYHSHGFRECMDCETRESLWADFGIVKKVHPDDQIEIDHGQAEGPGDLRAADSKADVPFHQAALDFGQAQTGE